MCTRYYIDPEAAELMSIGEEVQRSGLCIKFIRPGYAINTSGEMKPMLVVPVIASSQKGNRKVFPMRWGIRIPDKPILAHVKAERVLEYTDLGDAWKRCRCIIPASWYYEFEHLTGVSGQKKLGDRYLVQPKGDTAAWICGVYKIENDLPVFVMLTRKAPYSLVKIHDRMPVMLPEDLISEWIRPDADPDKLLTYSLTEMVTEKTD